MPRYALLRHIDAPDDPTGCHYDLLLEAGGDCRTWRLASIPSNAAPAQPAVPLPAHRLIWLTARSAAVSGGRGWAERIAAGRFEGQLPDDPSTPLRVRLLDGPLAGDLQITSGQCHLLPLTQP